MHHVMHQLQYKIMHTHIYINNLISNIWSIGMHINDNGYILHMRYKNKMNERKNENKNKDDNRPMLFID